MLVGKMVQDVENVLILEPKDPGRIERDMLCWGCRSTRYWWKECLTPREGNKLPFKLAN